MPADADRLQLPAQRIDGSTQIPILFDRPSAPRRAPDAERSRVHGRGNIRWLGGQLNEAVSGVAAAAASSAIACSRITNF